MKIGETKEATKLLTYSRENEWDDQYISVPLNNGKFSEIIRNPFWKSGLYIEHGMLEETTLLEVDETDEDGRSVGSLGIFRVKPEWFTVELNETHQKDKTWYEYRLTEEGWKSLEEVGLKHHGRGYTRYELITEDDLKLKKEKARLEIEKIVGNLGHLNKLG